MYVKCLAQGPTLVSGAPKLSSLQKQVRSHQIRKLIWSCSHVKLTTSAALITIPQWSNLSALAYNGLLDSKVRKLSMKTEGCW